MSYLVLARKYRPQTFEQVVKQEHVTQTLANAISSDRVAHAILFSGPRGTGKTTIARVLAKAMNCKEGPTPVPCNECRSCIEITSGSAADVFEIDGASNNGVDQIRELRENLCYMPAHSPYKIYIIDEVHMLSIPAFNALLKTLEEPPAHIMFLFATTEPHKIPITILSRCQRHDLRRIDIDSVSKHMEFLCAQEEINIAQESLGLIARESDGSMRDGLSLLDQVMSCSEGEITHEQVLDLLGIIDRKILFDISAGILRGDITEILDIFDDIYDHGHNIKELYSDLIEHFRNLLVVRMGKKVSKLVDIPTYETELMTEQTKNVPQVHLSQLLDILFKEEASIYLSSQPKLALEMAFIRMFQAKPVLPVDALIEKLDNLRKGIYENPSDDDAEPEPTIPVQRKTYPQSVHTGDKRNAERPVTSEPEAHPQSARGTWKQEGNGNTRTGDQENKISAEQRDISEPEPAVMPVPSDAGIHFDPNEDSEQTWKKLLDIISEKNPLLGVNMEKCTLKALTGQRLEIEINGNGFSAKRIKKDEAIIKKVCNDFFRKEMELVIKAGEYKNNGRQQKKNETDHLKQEALKHPVVQAALDIFGNKVVEVKVLQ